MPAKIKDPRDIAFKGAIGREQCSMDMGDVEVAERMNVTRQTIARWKKDPGSMSLAHFRRMAKALHFTDEEILRSIR